MPKKRGGKKKKKVKKKRANRISVRASILAWQKLIDDESGDPYYYNSVTQVFLLAPITSFLIIILCVNDLVVFLDYSPQETTWDEPPGFKGDGSLAADIGDPFEESDDEAVPAAAAVEDDSDNEEEEEEHEFSGKIKRAVSTARGGVAREKWWEKKAEKEVFAVWQECMTDEGLPYYVSFLLGVMTIVFVIAPLALARRLTQKHKKHSGKNPMN